MAKAFGSRKVCGMKALPDIAHQGGLKQHPKERQSHSILFYLDILTSIRQLHLLSRKLEDPSPLVPKLSCFTEEGWASLNDGQGISISPEVANVNNMMIV
jgi:hypothetical protein